MAKSPLTETIIANSLVAIHERLDEIEKTMWLIAEAQSKLVPPANVQASPIPSNPPKPLPKPSVGLSNDVLLERLDKLTLKRHAVLTATLGGLSYQAIAELMACSKTTVKLNLKSSLNVLGVRDRTHLLVTYINRLDFIPEEEYEARYGLGKRWYLEENPNLLAALRATKPAHNQHVVPLISLENAKGEGSVSPKI